MLYSYSTVYTSISGLRFSSNGATQSYYQGSNPNPYYYSLSRLCDGNLKNAYIVTSSYTNVVVTVSLPRNMFIHHIRIYPVCSKYMLFYRPGSPCWENLYQSSRVLTEAAGRGPYSNGGHSFSQCGPTRAGK